jgi:hypothetical protein
VQQPGAVFAHPIQRTVVAFEAGRDGFWLARWLRAHDIEAFVIHPSSVAVSREHRRAKTDRLDTELLKRAFIGWDHERIHRIQGCGASTDAPSASSTRLIHSAAGPDDRQHAAVLGSIKTRPGNDRAQGKGRATAGLDRPCARLRQA